MKGPIRYRIAATGIKIGVWMLRFVPRQVHVGKLRAWTRGRALPPLPGRTLFRTWWRRRDRTRDE
jgi:hypothetical protein